MNKFYLLLVKLGFRSDLTGTKYLAYLCEIYDDKLSTQELYNKIAEKFNVSTKSVERNIRTCKEKSWYTFYHLTLKNNFPFLNEMCIPTNKLLFQIINSLMKYTIIEVGNE